MRPTLLMFRSPKERTPGFHDVIVTNNGNRLDYTPSDHIKYKLSQSFSNNPYPANNYQKRLMSAATNRLSSNNQINLQQQQLSNRQSMKKQKSVVNKSHFNNNNQQFNINNLLYMRNNKQKNQSIFSYQNPSSFAQGERFPDYKVLAKKTPETIGPGCYNVQKSFDIIRRKACPAKMSQNYFGNFVGGQNNGYIYVGNQLVYDPELAAASTNIVNFSQQRSSQRRGNSITRYEQMMNGGGGSGINNQGLGIKSQLSNRSHFNNQDIQQPVRKAKKSRDVIIKKNLMSKNKEQYSGGRESFQVNQSLQGLSQFTQDDINTLRSRSMNQDPLQSQSMRVSTDNNQQQMQHYPNQHYHWQRERNEDITRVKINQVNSINLNDLMREKKISKKTKKQQKKKLSDNDTLTKEDYMRRSIELKCIVNEQMNGLKQLQNKNNHNIVAQSQNISRVGPHQILQMESRLLQQSQDNKVQSFTHRKQVSHSFVISTTEKDQNKDDIHDHRFDLESDRTIITNQESNQQLLQSNNYKMSSSNSQVIIDKQFSNNYGQTYKNYGINDKNRDSMRISLEQDTTTQDATSSMNTGSIMKTQRQY
eukprot:403334214